MDDVEGSYPEGTTRNLYASKILFLVKYRDISEDTYKVHDVTSSEVG